MDEVRVWRVARSDEQIRQAMLQRLTGKEEGLAALWNFDDVANGVVKDSGPGAHHGKLMGQAKVVEATLPSATTLPPWSRLLVRVTDASGASLQNVNVRAEVNGVEVGSATSGEQGIAPLTMWTTASAVDLVASSTNDFVGWQLSVPITPYVEHTNIWRLGRATHIAGHALALDGKTPHASLVVELVQPVEAGVPPAVEPGILPGGCAAGFEVSSASRGRHSGRQDAVLYGSQDGCRYSRKPALNTYGRRTRHAMARVLPIAFRSARKVVCGLPWRRVTAS